MDFRRIIFSSNEVYLVLFCCISARAKMLFEFCKKPINSAIALLACAFMAHTTTCLADNSKYMGVGSCSSSNCHGSVTASGTSNILRNEFYTWYKFDKHAKSFNVLLSPESKKIAFHLGISNPAEDQTCLNCHATNAPTSNRGERFRLEDGVGCESCHGASESWLALHTEKLRTHKENISNGMHDLSDPVKRTSMCGSCHVGNSENKITHSLYGAGHPRLSFELDTFEAVQPRHWRIDKDYKERKGTYSATQNWALGQIALAKLQLEQIIQYTNKPSLFPEFAQYSCFSCHQSITGKFFMNKEKREHPGLPSINTVHLDTVKIILLGVNYSDAENFSQNIDLLRSSSNVSDSVDATNKLLSQIKDISITPNSIDPKKMGQQISAYAASHEWIDFQLAEQLVMAISAINEDSKFISSDRLSSLYKLVEAPERYNSGYLSNALKTLKYG